MELPWNICPFCGTPAPGMRKEGATMDDVLRSLPEEKLKPSSETLPQELPAPTDEPYPEEISYPVPDELEVASPEDEPHLEE
jgi:hypothetical protein